MSDTQIVSQKEIKSTDKITNEEIIGLIIKNRQIKNIDEFVKPTSPLKIKPSDLKIKTHELKKLIKILKSIKKENEMIVVYTDYDADGITGGTILWETLYILGFKVMPYVPHRKNEGYGFSKKGIDTIKKLYQPKLIISVDHGISGHEKITYAKSLGIDVIVTDHHLKSEIEPKDALAIFHIPELSGAGVAYFIAKEIFENFKFKISCLPAGKVNFKSLEDNFNTDYLALASIGTIADLIPLVGPSRSLVKFGLESFSKITNPGLKHILREAGIYGKKITPYEIGFIIAPRINAVGRLEHAIDALRLLCTKKEEKAFFLANFMGNKNRERQDMVKKALEEAEEIVKRQTLNFKRLSKIIILKSEMWHEGIIGLIASKISEKYFRPSMVLTKSDGFYKGSARSIPGFDITNFLRQFNDYLIDVGGHKQASGFTVDKNNLNDFIKKVNQEAEKKIKERFLKKKTKVDLRIPISKINLKLALLIEKLQPFGIGNPQPVFHSQAEIINAQIFGKKNNHLKIFVKDPQTNSFPFELISFSCADQFFKLSKGKIIDVVYSLEVDRWGRNERLRGKILNFSN